MRVKISAPVRFVSGVLEGVEHSEGWSVSTDVADAKHYTDWALESLKRGHVVVPCVGGSSYVFTGAPFIRREV